MNISAQNRRRAFSHWLRTGFWPTVRTPDGVELKFNPYHDPRNGQFTFAPGGPQSLSDVIVSYGRRGRPDGLAQSGRSPGQTPSTGPVAGSSTKPVAPPLDAMNNANGQAARLQLASFPRNPRASPGGNSRPFNDPLTLAQTFPGLQNAPGGAIIALADNVFDFGGPARAATAELTRNWTNTLIGQIRDLDPSYRFDSLGFPQTLQGQVNQLNGLRFDRAATLLKVRGELRPLQVETLRFVQASADRAYDQGVKLLREGKLNVRLSAQEALGNFIDREVRIDLRKTYGRYGIDSAGKGPVRVNRREDDSSGSDLTFRRPDARVGTVAFDVTLTQKTLATAQVRGFFGTDFQPSHVVIIRPRQVAPNNTYIITRPEAKR